MPLPVTPFIPATIRVFLHNLSHNKVVIHETLSAYDTSPRYWLRCTICNANDALPFDLRAWEQGNTGFDLDFMEDFCKTHETCDPLYASKSGKILQMKEKIEALPEPPTGRKFR